MSNNNLPSSKTPIMYKDHDFDLEGLVRDEFNNFKVISNRLNTLYSEFVKNYCEVETYLSSNYSNKFENLLISFDKIINIRDKIAISHTIEQYLDLEEIGSNISDLKGELVEEKINYSKDLTQFLSSLDYTNSNQKNLAQFLRITYVNIR